MANTCNEELALLERRLQRERAARESAERLLDARSLELYNALQSVSEVQRRLELALRASGEAIWEWDCRSDQFEVQSFGEDAAALPAKCRLRRELLPAIHPDDRQRVKLAWQLHVCGSEESFDCAFRLQGQDGRGRWIRVRGRAIAFEEDRSPIRVLGTLKDVTRQRLSEENQKLMAQALSVSSEAIAITDVCWEIVEANAAFSRLVEAPADTLTGRRLTELLPLTDLVRQAPLTSGATTAGELRLPGRDGRSRFLQVLFYRMAVNGAGEAFYVASFRDTTDDRRASLELMKLSMLDEQSGLPNRNTLLQHLDARLAGAGEDTTFAVLLISLHGLREVTEGAGAQSAGSLLRELITRLEPLLHPDDILGRHADDELLLLLQAPSGAPEADRLARSIIRTLSAPVELRDQQLHLPVNIGIVIAPRDGADSAALVRRADSAAYAAKEASYDSFEFYRPELDTNALVKVHLSTLLRSAVKRNEFRFVVQPKVDSEKRIVGGEMLIRWDTEQYGQVSPGRFIPIAEQTGAIGAIGRLAIANATGLIAELQRRGVAFPVAVNVSSRQASDVALESTLLDACDRNGVDPALVELEITESVLISNLAGVRRLIRRLRSLGFTLSLDDFGTGYSSLTISSECLSTS